ncbi:MAG TPA: PilZ domain-containing protein [Spirochaetia bacterium]|nr:PilZ domain-containing protein [Spirochaetia bacterium]
MDQLVFCSHEIDAELVNEALPEVAVSTVYARRSLVEAIVANAQLIGAIVEPDADDDWPAFLASIRRSFPLIPLLVLSDACSDGYACVDPNQPREPLVGAIADFYTTPRPAERRRHHRYEWPLRATIAGSSTVHRIHEISAGGAFLEPASPIPEPRTECEIQVRFQNFTMTTMCEILDPRHVSSRAAPGFGVRFTALSGTAEEFIDSVVTDALARVLLDPTSVPEVPSIDEEEDILAVGDEFSLSL